MLDGMIQDRGVLELRRHRMALRPFAGIELNEQGLDPSMESTLTPWTADVTKTYAYPASLAQPSELQPGGAYTASVGQLPEVWIDFGQQASMSSTSTAAFGLKSVTEPLTAHRHATPFRIVLRRQDCFVLKTSEESAFTERDTVEEQGESVEAMILAVPSSLAVPYANTLSRRLAELFAASRQEAETELEMSRSSLRWFLDFMRSNAGLACPLVGLSPEGNIYAAWKRDRDALFSAHFLPSGLVRFVVFTPNPRHRGAVTRLSGATTASNLLDTVRPHGVLSWASREG